MTYLDLLSSPARVAVLTATLSAGWCAPATAQLPPNITVGEMALLPEYCVDTQGFGYGDQWGGGASPRAPYWVGLMGPGFWAVHHYCWGLIKLRRAMAPAVPDILRRGGLGNVIGEFQYVIRNTTPGFLLLPEIYLKMGDVYLLLQNPGAANEAYAAARRIKPDYWPACVNWAEALAKLKLNREAQNHVAECLRQTPNEPALQDAFRRFGGNVDAFLRSLPKPQPTAPKAPAVAASAAG